MIIAWYNSLAITQKLRLGLTVLALIAIVSFGGAYAYVGVMSLDRSIAASTENTANIIGSSLVASLRFENPDVARDKLKSLTPDSSYKSVCVYKLNGEAFTSYPDNTTCQALKVLWNGTFEDRKFDNAEQTSIIRNIWSDGQVVGAIQIARSKEAITNYLVIQLKTMAVIAIGCLFLCDIIAKYLRKVITRPIADIATNAELISIMHDFDQRLNHSTNDEIGQLARAFNSIVGFMNSRNKELSTAYQNVRRAHHLTLEKMKEIADEFHVPVDAFELYIQNSVKQVRHADARESSLQQLELLESLNEYQIRLNSVTRISGIYSRAISESLSVVSVKEYVAKFQNKLKSHIPDTPCYMLDILAEDKTRPSAEIYKLAWDELFRLMSELVTNMSNIAQFPTKLEFSLKENSDELSIALMHLKAKSTNSNLRLVAHEEESVWNPVISYARNSIEDPDAANDFLDESVMQRRDAKFMLDTMSYISNANSIEFSHYFGQNLFVIRLGLKAIRVPDVPQPYIEVCQ